jgi:hypothetical protein
MKPFKLEAHFDGARQAGEFKAGMYGTPWKLLYQVSGVAAIVMAVFIPIQIIIFAIWPPPSTVTGWFSFFQDNRLIAIIDMDLLLIVDQFIMALLFLALYVALRRAGQSLMAISLTFGLLGIAGYIASSGVFNMLSLSDQYTAATTEAQRAAYLAAGQATLTNYQGTAFDVGYVLEGVALLLAAIVMLKSPLFNKPMAYLGVATGIMALVPPTLGIVGMIFALGSLLPLEVWAVLLAIRFFQIAQEPGDFQLELSST